MASGEEAMNGIMYVSWLVGPVLQITLLIFMIRRKLQVVLPRFFFYIVLQIVKSVILFLIYRYYPENYFDAYWSGNAISVLLAVTVMDEILHNLLKQYGGIQSLTSIIFRWACGLLLLLSIVNAFSSQQTSADRVVSAVLAFERSGGGVEGGVFFLFFIFFLVLSKFFRGRGFWFSAGIRNLCEHRANAGQHCDALRRRSGRDPQPGEECSIQWRYASLDYVPKASKRTGTRN